MNYIELIKNIIINNYSKLISIILKENDKILLRDY